MWSLMRKTWWYMIIKSIMGPWAYTALHELTTLYYYERWICGVRLFLSAKSLEAVNKLIWNGAEHFSGADAGNGGVASGGVSHFRGQSLLLRLRVLRCTRHSLRRCWPSLLQRMLHWGFHRFHFWEWQVYVQGNIINFIYLCFSILFYMLPCTL